MGQHIQWKHGDKHGWRINVHQNVAVDELQEIAFDKSLKYDTPLTPQMHAAYRSVLGQINWLQSRTQFHIGYHFSKCASKAASPTIGEVRAINKTVRTIKSIPLSMRFWPLHGKARIVGYPDASYRNNEDKSSQRAHVIFLTEERDLRRRVELKSFMLQSCTDSCAVTVQPYFFAVSGQTFQAKSLMFTFDLMQTNWLQQHRRPINQNKESNSGQMHDLAHVRGEGCLAESLTNHSAKPDELIKAVLTGNLLNVDAHPQFRTMLQNKALLLEWLAHNTKHGPDIFAFAGAGVAESMFAYWGTWA